MVVCDSEDRQCCLSETLPKRSWSFPLLRSAATRGEPLPAPSAAFKDAWVKAASDAKKGEYSFRGNYNVWDQDEPSKDWDGLAGLGFT